uniref:ATP synthase complex subunit 8 n=1 Tax=Diamesus osculans TaxID=414948 RepID=A0A6C0RUL0_9COLE|nr:ATP synthase F0 subunit 8 [Diamesus osculans]QIA46737.1 ATP synthase F0 subunit 8 [Diamesus osculans]
MPQMAPMNWLILLIIFMIIFMMFNVLNYFSFKYPVKKNFNKKLSSKLNWKW